VLQVPMSCTRYSFGQVLGSADTHGLSADRQLSQTSCDRTRPAQQDGSCCESTAHAATSRAGMSTSAYDTFSQSKDVPAEVRYHRRPLSPRAGRSGARQIKQARTTAASKHYLALLPFFLTLPFRVHGSSASHWFGGCQPLQVRISCTQTGSAPMRGETMKSNNTGTYVRLNINIRSCELMSYLRGQSGATLALLAQRIRHLRPHVPIFVA